MLRLPQNFDEFVSELEMLESQLDTRLLETGGEFHDKTYWELLVKHRRSTLAAQQMVRRATEKEYRELTDPRERQGCLRFLAHMDQIMAEQRDDLNDAEASLARVS